MKSQGGSSLRYKEISERASMATSQNFMLQNLNEVSTIPKHIIMLIINDSEALVNIILRLFLLFKATCTNSVLLILAGYKEVRLHYKWDTFV